MNINGEIKRRSWVDGEKGKSHVVGVEWRKDRLVGNEVRKVMELGVEGCQAE